MRQYSINLFTLRLPKDFRIHDSVNEKGKTQTSLIFAFRLIGSEKGFKFADKLADIIKRIEK